MAGGEVDAFRLAERIRANLAARTPDPVTVSIGIASFPAQAGDIAGLMARADSALYAAKRSGRNRVTLAEQT